ncbi:hypothetical protein SSABA_v1c01420 [Spiroplasma sabaudiense Ar-1343]|uniref:J domain-containing protein n=1 Tax=Spiroplasma sabaudiense Ar-1343 TaxID=1276257 RepID=W6AIM1_9MOLU|nr:DnaJ domain-containing protein [Spiroplasma sabaudiense]AHI53554.1 hypothetical protein SSABA_v1c01420 [Spiroplasma sabaudiense Ar-1343]
MGWKNNYKKAFKNKLKNSKSVNISYFEPLPYFILWEREHKQVNEWNEETLMREIKLYQTKILSFKTIHQIPEEFNEQVEVKFMEDEIVEKFTGLPAISNFQATYNYFLKKMGKYKALVMLFSITKFTYYTTSKFWQIYMNSFSSYDVEKTNFKRIFLVMRRTSFESIENLLKKLIILVGKNEIDQYRHHMLIEEIIEGGEDLTFHWARMLEQIIESSFESISFESRYGKPYEGYSQDETLDSPFGDPDQDNFDKFFEQTHTLVINDEVNEAFNFFGLTKMTEPSDFKKTYRHFAKKFHPDVNSNESSASEMKKINIYKQIIEDYFDRYNIT